MQSHLKTNSDDVEKKNNTRIRYLSNWVIIMGNPLFPAGIQINAEDIETAENPIFTIKPNFGYTLTLTPTHRAKIEIENMKVCAAALSRILANDEKLSFDDKIINSSPAHEWINITIFRNIKSPTHTRKSQYLWNLIDSLAPKRIDPKMKESKPITYLISCLDNNIEKNQWAIFSILAALANAVFHKTTDQDELEPWNHLDRDNLVNFLLYFYIELQFPNNYQKFSSFTMQIKSSLKQKTEEAVKYLLLSFKNDLIVKEADAYKLLPVVMKLLNHHMEKQVTQLPDETMYEKIELTSKTKKSWCNFFATKVLPIAVATTAAVALTSRSFQG